MGLVMTFFPSMNIIILLFAKHVCTIENDDDVNAKMKRLFIRSEKASIDTV